MERTKQQQNELDNIERKILICVFGKETIPESTSIALRLMNVNPNDLIRKFENVVIPIMKDNGYIDGKMFKKIIQFSKYKDLCSVFTIPEGDFLLSDITNSLIGTFVPGFAYEKL